MIGTLLKNPIVVLTRELSAKILIFRILWKRSVEDLDSPLMLALIAELPVL